MIIIHTPSMLTQVAEYIARHDLPIADGDESSSTQYGGRMRRTMTRSEAQVMQAGSCYRQRQRARKVLARAERDLANFRELLGYPASSRQRQKYVRAARDVARRWWLAIIDWQEASDRCSAIPVRESIDIGYILPRWDLYIKRQRLLDLKQNDSDPGVMA